MSKIYSCEALFARISWRKILRRPKLREKSSINWKRKMGTKFTGTRLFFKGARLLFRRYSSRLWIFHSSHLTILLTIWFPFSAEDTSHYQNLRLHPRDLIPSGISTKNLWSSSGSRSLLYLAASCSNRRDHAATCDQLGGKNATCQKKLHLPLFLCNPYLKMKPCCELVFIEFPHYHSRAKCEARCPSLFAHNCRSNPFVEIVIDLFGQCDIWYSWFCKTLHFNESNYILIEYRWSPPSMVHRQPVINHRSPPGRNTQFRLLSSCRECASECLARLATASAASIASALIAMNGNVYHFQPFNITIDLEWWIWPWFRFSAFSLCFSINRLISSSASLNLERTYLAIE